MITERIYVRNQSLGEVHEQAARLQEAGWKKASGLMYTHDQDGSGWEIALYREIDEMGDYPYPLDKYYNGIVRAVFILVVGAAVFAATLSALKLTW